MTHGYGADICVDAVGIEGNQSFFSDSKKLIQGWSRNNKIVFDDIITHKVHLKNAPKLHDIFNNKGR